MFGKFLGILAVVVLLAGCGGGGGGASSLPIPSGVLVSGVAASGAPIQGIVYAKDQTGKTSIPAVINGNGTYTVTVAGLTSPYLLTAIGISGGKPVTLHSMGDTSDTTSGNVNITPLTELMVALASGVTGDDLESICSGCPTYSTVFNNLSSAQTTIKTMIVPLLTQMNVSSLVDLRTTSFSANNTGLDAVLDALTVDAPIMGQTANISLAGVGTVLGSVTLSSTVGSAATPSAGSYNATALAQAQNLAAALKNIDMCLASLQSLYSTSIPSAGQVSNFLAPTVLNDGNNRSTEATALSTDVSSGGVASIGMKILGGASAYDALIHPVSFDASNNPTSVWIYLTAGQSTLGLTEMTPTGTSTGSCPGGWQIAGDQRPFGFTIQPVISKTVPLSSPVAYERLLALSVDAAPAHTAGVTAATVTGPGLPAAGVNLIYVSGQSHFIINDPYYSATSSYFLKDCTLLPTNSTAPCFNSNPASGSILASGGVYTTTFTGGAVPAYTDRLDQAPYSVADIGNANLTAFIFPIITNITPASSSSFVTTPTQTASATWTMPADASSIYLGVALGSLQPFQSPQLSPSATSYSLSINATGLTSPTSGIVTVETNLNGMIVVTNKYF